MHYGWMADAVVAIHALFIVFAVLGGFLALRRPWIAALHLPAMAWASYIEFAGGICPLTPLENELRALAGERGYSGGFIEHYILPVMYPAGLTRDIQLVLGAAVLIINLLAYGLLIRKLARRS